MTEILALKAVAKAYPVRRGLFSVRQLQALDAVSFSVKRGKTIAVVGESGCGKSTLARVLSGIEKPSSGEIFLAQESYKQLAPEAIRKRIQMVFQDPYGSINPRKRAGEIIGEPLAINTSLSKAERRQRVLEVMASVGLRPELIDRFPHMFSGGQRQRIGIARALVLRPEILILDEPVSALDISIQAQVLNLLLDLQDNFQLTYIFISHDLSVVRHIADEVVVMYLGQIVERGTREQIFSRPSHPYTQALLGSTPKVNPAARTLAAPLQGELPSPLDPPSGCAFHQRCPKAMDRCRENRPALLRTKDDRDLACFLAEAP